MGIIKRNCPHCKTQHVAFSSVLDWVTHDGGRRSLFLCGSCNEGVTWEWHGAQAPKNISGDLDRYGLAFGEQWPKPIKGQAPNDTPATTANFFEQATSSLEAGNYDAAGMMFRKALESATKILDPSAAEQKLFKRIDSLTERQVLTPDLATWAHEIRLGGNDAAHEDEPFTKDDADSLKSFTESFLIYTFTLPTAVRRRSVSEG